ncbi:MAG TPA: PQQ-binding-like beta-propeller repeat protein [Polyangia bacterium]|nr:PQQ-binding-like beta-propeller repeat protein [Polyangia bacterium]
MIRRASLVALATLLASCVSATTRVAEPTTKDTLPRAGLISVRWRTEVHARKLFQPSPEECASGAIAGDHLVIGSRGGKALGVRLADGQIDWSTPLTGGVDSDALFDASHGQVYVGADDGSFYALDAKSGAIRFSYATKGAVERAPALSADTVYFASASDRVVALDATSGKWRWQYERETPDGFTIHGYGAPTVVGDQVLAGFADGYLVSLQAGTGEVVWAKSLASTSDQFVDVDSTPLVSAGTIFAASYSGGVYGLEAKDGAVRWRLPTEGAGNLSLIQGRLFFAAPRQGLHAVSSTGQILWRQGLSEAGDLTAPQPMAGGRYLVFSGSRGGLFIVDARDGDLMEVFNPGDGICASATLDPAGGRLYVLSNGGTLYALDVG